MVKKMMVLGATLLLASGLAWASPDSWTGVVRDSHCGLKHSKASPAAAKCVEKCVSGGGKYVFVSGGRLYQVEPQEKFQGNPSGSSTRFAASQPPPERRNPPTGPGDSRPARSTSA